MAKIAIIFDTESKTMITMRDGQTIPEHDYISFHSKDMKTAEGRKTYYMNMEHRSEEQDGMHVMTRVEAEYDKDGKKKKKKKSMAEMSVDELIDLYSGGKKPVKP